MSTRILTLITGIALALGLALPATGAELRGEIMSIDAEQNRFELRTEDGRQVSISTSNDTQIHRDGQAIQLSSFQEGDRVTVSTESDPAQTSGELAATRVESASDRQMATRDQGQQTQGQEGQQSQGMQDRQQAGQQDRQGTQTAQRLPSTASPLPALALIGVGSLAGAFGLRRLRRR